MTSFMDCSLRSEECSLGFTTSCGKFTINTSDSFEEMKWKCNCPSKQAFSEENILFLSENQSLSLLSKGFDFCIIGLVQVKNSLCTQTFYLMVNPVTINYIPASAECNKIILNGENEIPVRNCGLVYSTGYKLFIFNRVIVKKRPSSSCQMFLRPILIQNILRLRGEFCDYQLTLDASRTGKIQWQKSSVCDNRVLFVQTLEHTSLLSVVDSMAVLTAAKWYGLVAVTSKLDSNVVYYVVLSPDTFGTLNICFVPAVQELKSFFEYPVPIMLNDTPNESDVIDLGYGFTFIKNNGCNFEECTFSNGRCFVTSNSVEITLFLGNYMNLYVSAVLAQELQETSSFSIVLYFDFVGKIPVIRKRKVIRADASPFMRNKIPRFGGLATNNSGQNRITNNYCRSPHSDNTDSESISNTSTISSIDMNSPIPFLSPGDIDFTSQFRLTPLIHKLEKEGILGDAMDVENTDLKNQAAVDVESDDDVEVESDNDVEVESSDLKNQAVVDVESSDLKNQAAVDVESDDDVEVESDNDVEVESSDLKNQAVVDVENTDLKNQAAVDVESDDDVEVESRDVKQNVIKDTENCLSSLITGDDSCSLKKDKEILCADCRTS
jgi:hypothetical protein